MTKFVGYQTRADWLGDDLLTLADIWPRRPRGMIVGLNPVPASVDAGHYYQGRAGKRQLMRLVEVGVIGPPNGTYFEEDCGRWRPRIHRSRQGARLAASAM
ncbi:hypothetical protein [Agromyces sp. NPDC049794]|uniref:hypothetical protein n=1 Tax=unclassified Agromyces TaxID=2639701 RepID=UPI003408744D